MEELLGKPVAEEIEKECLAFLAERLGVMPALALIRVGEDEADITYEKAIKKRFLSLGLEVKTYQLPPECSNEQLQEVLQFLNDDEEIHGIMVFLPLPSHLDKEAVFRMIKREKDVEGISRENMAGLILKDKNSFAPCTAQAVLEMCHFYNIPLAGKEVCILGRSPVVGRPLSILMTNEDATVTLCHSKTSNIKEVTKRADVLVCCMGRAKAIGSSYCKEGATVIDVGTNWDEQGNQVGDVDFDTMATVAGKISPVPRGLGAVTTAVLAKQLLKAYSIQEKG
ncbi:bifunctional 5,10-methylenetetrahydrofolate dehydrogenase/5,10-methenyltetrahydrofolate cyclohydrolase [Oribacterium sp.]